MTTTFVVSNILLLLVVWQVGFCTKVSDAASIRKARHLPPFVLLLQSSMDAILALTFLEEERTKTKNNEMYNRYVLTLHYHNLDAQASFDPIDTKIVLPTCILRESSVTALPL